MYTFQKSTRKNKKYMVKYNNKWIHFGDTRYQQFRDSTPLKLYKYLDHNDEKRRTAYTHRAMHIVDKYGHLTFLDKNYPNFWAYKYLWS